MTAQIWNKVTSLMVDTVSFYSETARDKYGKPTFAVGATVVKGRFMYGEAKKRTVNNVEVTEVGKFITYGPTTVTVNDKMSTADGKSYTITDVNPISDENGVHHTVVTFGY